MGNHTAKSNTNQRNSLSFSTLLGDLSHHPTNFHSTFVSDIISNNKEILKKSMNKGNWRLGKTDLSYSGISISQNDRLKSKIMGSIIKTQTIKMEESFYSDANLKYVCSMIKTKEARNCEKSFKNSLSKKSRYNIEEQSRYSGKVLTDSHYRSGQSHDDKNMMSKLSESGEFITYSIPFALDVCNTQIKTTKILQNSFHFLKFNFWNYQNLKINICIKNRKKSFFGKRDYNYCFLRKTFYENKQADFNNNANEMSKGKLDFL